MKIKNVAVIEVQGIENIIIDREFLWKKCSGEETYWFLLLSSESNGVGHSSKSPEAMARYVNDLISNPGRRAWVHGDTLNIVKRPVKPKALPLHQEIETTVKKSGFASFCEFCNEIREMAKSVIAKRDAEKQVRDAGNS